jgi:predicted metal-dependent HD superfamily phosphohydrolase
MIAQFGVIESRLNDPRAVLVALLFHDAVYDPHSVDNERSSAELLTSLADGALPPESLDRAREMVLATVGHALPGGLSKEEGEDLAHFLDLDLAILGADPARYAEYEAQIRREYADIPEDTYRPARAAILQRFLRREPIYFTDWGRAKFEAQAHANLARSIVQLRGTGAPAG